MKGVRITKIFKEIKFEGVWGRVRGKELFPQTIIHMVFEANSGFRVR